MQEIKVDPVVPASVPGVLEANRILLIWLATLFVGSVLLPETVWTDLLVRGCVLLTLWIFAKTNNSSFFSLTDASRTIDLSATAGILLLSFIAEYGFSIFFLTLFFLNKWMLSKY